jgi:hypothetical protein
MGQNCSIESLDSVTLRRGVIFRAIDRETGFLLPPSVDEWLREKHLARFAVE